MEQNEKKSIKGIRIRTVNFVMILISCVLYVMLIAATIHVSGKYENVHHSMDDYISFEESDTLLSEGSAYLTEQVRLYVITAEPQYMEQYFTEVHDTGRREEALERLKESYYEEEAYRYLEAALESSNNLMSQEIYAMKLVAAATGEAEERLPAEIQETVLEAEDRTLSAEEMLVRAQELVFGEEYQSAKDQIIGSVKDALASIHEMTHEKMLHSADELEQTMRSQRLLISILFVETIITFVMILLLIIKPLQIYIKCIREDKMMEIIGSYEFKYLALTYNDIYEVNTANEAMLRYQAEHDPLTGIINRGAFEQLKRLFKRTYHCHSLPAVTVIF